MVEVLENMVGTLWMLAVTWPRCLVQSGGGGKSASTSCTWGFIWLPFSMETISSPLHSQQAHLSIGMYLKHPKVSLVIHESVARVCRTGQLHTTAVSATGCWAGQTSFLNTCAYFLLGVWFLTSNNVDVVTHLANTLLLGGTAPCFLWALYFFPISSWSRSQTFPLCLFISLTQLLEARIRAGALLHALSIWGRRRTMASRTSAVCHCLLQLPAALCRISGAERVALSDLSPVLLLLEMRLGNTEKFLSAKYLFFIGNNIRNRVNIWKAFKKLLEELWACVELLQENRKYNNSGRPQGDEVLKLREKL